MNNLKLKRATVNDINSILEIEKGLVGTKIYSGLTGAEDAIKEITENTFYLIKKDDKVVGDIAYQIKDKDHVYISGLAVVKELHRQGIAKQAMQMLLEILKDVKNIDLVTHPENEGAIKLYKSLGFKQIGEPIKNYFDDGEPRIKMILEK
jgi:ribosomal protein S18 acetylase RimI-like enzyme